MMNEQPKTSRFQLPATLEALAQLEDIVKSVTADPHCPVADETEQYNFLLALHELCTNIVEHAYAGAHGDITIVLMLDCQPPTIRAKVIDSGAPYEQGGVTSPNLDEPQEGGYGLFLMEQLLDEVQYTRHQDRNEWQLIRRLS